MPEEATPCIKNGDVEPPTGYLSYISVVGMLLYLAGNFDLTFPMQLILWLGIYYVQNIFMSCN